MVDDVPSLLRALMTHDLGRPRITWYGAAGERVELSAKTLDNWVAKTANVLVDTLDAGPCTRVVIDLPPHWRTAVWLLGTWSAGACVVAAGWPGDVIVTTRPEPDGHAWMTTGNPYIVAVALPALAASFGADLPPDAIDGAVEVRAHGDVFVPIVRPDAADPALGAISHGDLLTGAAVDDAQNGWPEGVRLLVTTSAIAAAVPSSPIWLLGPLVRKGSVVIVDDTSADAHDAGSIARIAAQEGVTATVS